MAFYLRLAREGGHGGRKRESSAESFVRCSPPKCGASRMLRGVFVPLGKVHCGSNGTGMGC